MHAAILGALVGTTTLFAASQASLTAYGDFDRVSTASTAAATRSLAAESKWLADAATWGPINVVDFESATVGVNGITHTIAPGVRMSVQGATPDNLVVMSGTNSYGPTNGFNSTAGGNRHMSYEDADGGMWAPIVVFNFDHAITAFSCFITGEGSGAAVTAPFTQLFAGNSIQWDMGLGDGGTPYWPATYQPNVRFIGFTNLSTPTKTVSIHLPAGSSYPWRGNFSFDDVRWVEDIPAPSTLCVFGATLVFTRRRRA